MLPLVFRKFRREDSPPAGELWVRVRKEHRERAGRAVALLVVGTGLEAFDRGPGPVERIVVNAAGTGPTLDEMLAATLAARCLAGEDVACWEPFAHYAAAVRRGLIPTEHKPDEALENVFQAIRNQDGSDLEDPAVAGKFLDGWRRMIAVLTAAAAAGRNPVVEALFAADPAFVQERAYLRRDEEVYRSDVQRGRSWAGCLPGGLARCSALLLRQPRSLLFKYWARCDRQTPTGEPYRFLAVDWGQGTWICSTDPAHRLSLQPLAERLQQAEQAVNPAAAAANGWYDGRDFQHSLVGNPHGGTRLPADQVEQIILEWTEFAATAAPPPAPPKPGPAAPSPRPRLRKVLLAASVLVLAVAAAGLPWYFRPPGPPTAQQTLVTPDPVREQVFARWSGTRSVKLGSIIQDDIPAGERPEATFEFPSESERDARLQVELSGGPDLPASLHFNVLVSVNEGAERAAPASIREGQVKVDPVLVRLQAGPNKVRVRVEGKKLPAFTGMTCDFWENVSEAVLFVLTVGVSDYKDPRIQKLRYAHRDAAALAEAFGRQQGLFHTVHCRTLLNDKATRVEILKALRELVKQAGSERTERRNPCLVVVTFAGHGIRDEINKDFFFLPWDFDAEPGNPPEDKGLSGKDLRGILNAVPCPVVLVLDACHSGAAIPAVAGVRDVDDALRRLSTTAPGVILLAGCSKDQKAREDPDWGGGHGALSWALLENLKPHPRDGKDTPILFLDDFLGDARDTFKKLLEGKGFKGSQSWIIDPAPGLPLDTIPIAYIGTEKKAGPARE
jgi:hypothetical protein